jgi:probable phosphoglycerate mutase
MPEENARPEENDDQHKPPPARPTIVLFVRHGTTPTTGKVLPGQAPGLHLAEQGRTEAQRVAERLAALGPDVISAVYASSLERARETAAPIAKLLGRRTRIDGQLVDIDYGEWTGYEIAKVNKLPEWRAVLDWPSGFRFPGGESFVELQARIGGVVERLRRDHPGQVVVAVSHSDPIRIATAAVLGVSLDMFHRLVVAPCSVTALAYEEAGASVLTLNSTGDLATIGIGPAKK